jgi:hypothetical protein
MVRVLHFDHSKDYPDFYMSELRAALDKHPEIKFESISLPGEEHWSTGDLEKRLALAYDVLMIHPGRVRQRYVILELPVKFPRMAIGVFTLLPWEYEESWRNVTVLDVNNPENVVRYLLSKSR